MKDLNINELLRYFLLGVFILVLLYLLADKAIVKEKLEIFSNGDVFGVFCFISLCIGTILYVIYRAIFYPIINSLLTFCMRKKFHTEFKDISGSIIKYVDAKRWELADPLKSALSEWASQIHFLYNLSIGLLSIWIISILNPAFKQDNWIIISFIIVLISAVVHHVRYKNHEIYILKKN